MEAGARSIDAAYRRAAESLPWHRLFRAVFEGRRALGIMTGLFIVAGLVIIRAQLVVYDEGLLTYVFAQWIVRDPLPALFFQKIKPVACLIYAIPSLAGIEAMLALHVLVAALAAPMLAAAARALGIRLPNLPALILLVSPLFLVGAAVGVSNVDGVVAITLFLYLLVARRAFWLAGALLGCLPWLRSELAPFAIVMWLYAALAERNRAVVLGGLLFPVGYAIGGALYHRDLLWLLHFPPTTAASMPDNPIWAVQKIGLGYLLGVLLLVTPTIGLALAVRARSLTRLEGALAAFAVASLLLLSFLPFLGLGNFGPVARYSMQPLPILALLVARAVEPWLDGAPAPRWIHLIPLGLTAVWLGSHGPPAASAVPILVAAFAVAALAARGYGRAAVCAVAAMACLGVALPRDEMRTPAMYRPALAWLHAHADEVRGARIYTNSPVMPFGIASSSDLAETDVRFILAPDIMWEIDELSNPHNGQRDAIRRLARAELFGPTVAWSDLTPDAVPAGSLILLRQDPRTASLMPAATWARRLQIIGGDRRFSVARVLPPAAAPAALPEGAS